MKHLVGDGWRKRNLHRTPRSYMYKNNSMQIYCGLINQKLQLKAWRKKLTCEQKNDTKILSDYTCVDSFSWIFCDFSFCRKNIVSESSRKPNSCNISSRCWIRIDTKIFGKKSNYFVHGPWMCLWLCVAYVLFQATRVQYVSWWRETFQSNDSSLRKLSRPSLIPQIWSPK